MLDASRPTLPDLRGIRGFAATSSMAVALLQGPELRILYLNPAFLAALGRERAPLGQPLVEALPALAEAIARVQGSGGASRAAALPLPLGPDGGRFWDLELSVVTEPAGVLAVLRDVTETRAALVEAEAARATLDALFRHMPEGLILADAPEARLRRVSEEALRMVGLEAAAVLEQEAALHPATWQVFRADGVTPALPEELPLTRAVRQGETVTHETWVLKRADGTPVPILCNAGPIQEDGGPVRGGIVCFRDITDLSEAEAARSVQQARYRALVEAGSLAIWLADPDGAVRGEASWSSLTGQGQEEMAGLGWLEAIHPEDREAVRERWLAAIATGALYEAEYRLQRPDGGWRWTAARAVPRCDAAGRIVEWVGANTDIEARKGAEAALRSSEDRFRTLAEAMPHLVWQTDALGRPEYANGRWRMLTGLSGLAGAGWTEAVHRDDIAGLRAAWMEALATGGEYDADARIRTADGDYRWFRVKGAPVRDSAGRIRHWVGTCTDVEAQHQAEARLREALAAQERLGREAEHRIKNSLQLVASLLRLQSGRTPEPMVREALEAATARVQAVAEAHRALQLSPDLSSVRLSDMLRELAAGASVQHPGADIRIAAPEAVVLDAEQAIPLALALSELVEDALRHTQQEGPTHPVRLEATEEGGMLAVSVAEGGFTPPSDGAAAGLGQTMIRALARQVGAGMETSRSEDGGARITLRLALHQPAPPREEAGPARRRDMER